MAKTLSIAECEREYPEAFKDATGAVDRRLTEKIKRAMVHMINQGELNIAAPPDHFEQLPSAGKFPALLYSREGVKTLVVKDAEEQAAALKQGWVLKPTKAHVDKAQNKPGVARDERIEKLQKELDSELKAKASELVEAEK